MAAGGDGNGLWAQHSEELAILCSFQCISAGAIKFYILKPNTKKKRIGEAINCSAFRETRHGVQCKLLISSESWRLISRSAVIASNNAQPPAL